MTTKQPTQKDVIERTAQVTPPAKKEYTPEQFLAMFQKLCQETKMGIQAVPTWKARDDGTWSLVIQLTVVKLPEAQ